MHGKPSLDLIEAVLLLPIPEAVLIATTATAPVLIIAFGVAATLVEGQEAVQAVVMVEVLAAIFKLFSMRDI